MFMIYEFHCPSCGVEFTESRMLADRHRPAECACGEMVAKREIPSRLGGFIGAGDWDTCTYNPGLGQVVRNNLEAKKIAKSRGLTEVGSESIEAIHKRFDTDREKKLEARYDIGKITNLGEIRSN